MFIQSISNNQVEANNQTIFDSRNNKENKNNIKLERAIKMYKKGHPIVIKFIQKNKKDIEAVPYQLEDDTLFCEQEGKIIQLSLSQIKDIIIVRI